MIDWLELAGNALWVLGVAVCLATLSMAYFQARADQDRVGNRLKQPRFRLALAAGAGLICAGLLLGSGPWWEKAIWGLGAGLAVVWAVLSRRGRRSAGGGEA